MEDHPLREKLELFLHDRLSGDEAVEVLLHIEECEICAAYLSTQNESENPKDIIEKLLTDNPDHKTHDKSS